MNKLPSQFISFCGWQIILKLTVASTLEYFAHMEFPKITGPRAQTARNLDDSWIIQTNVQGRIAQRSLRNCS